LPIIRLEVTLLVYQVTGPTIIYKLCIGVVFKVHGPFKGSSGTSSHVADEASLYFFASNREMIFRECF
jgi:hypothetical protein